MATLRRLVEVFEAERYYPIAGWSKKLLATDRDIYANREGDWGFPTLDEYSDAVISTGWFWEQAAWQPATSDINVDSDGWSYAVDYSVFAHAIEAETRESLGGVRRGSVVFASDGAMSLADENMLLEMDAANKAAEMANIETDSGEETDSDGDTSPAALAASDMLNSVNDTDSSTTMSYVSEGEPVKSMLHFVRRRRMLRWQCFDPTQLTSVPANRLPCNHCDLRAVNDLAASLLTILATAAVTAHPRSFNEAKCNILKTKMMQALQLDCSEVKHLQKLVNGDTESAGSSEPTSTNGIIILSKADAATAIKEGEAPDEAKDDSEDEPSSTSSKSSHSSPITERGEMVVSYSIVNLVKDLLAPFLKELSTAGSTISSLLSKENTGELLGRRTADIAHSFFPSAERRLIAEAIIRRHDIPGAATSSKVMNPNNPEVPPLGTGYRYHCSKIGCGAKCEYAHEMCPTKKCGVEYSVRDRQRHQDECQYAYVECPRECGDTEVQRRQLSSHMQHSCPHRPAGCPFRDLGCMTELVAARVPEHMDVCTNSHLMLLLNRVVEQQHVIKMLHREAAETKAAAEEHAAETTAALSTALLGLETLSLKVDQTKQHKEHRDEIAKIQKAIGQIDANVQKQISGMATQINGNMEKERVRVNTEFRRMSAYLPSQPVRK